MLKQQIETFLHEPINVLNHKKLVDALIVIRAQAIQHLASQSQESAAEGVSDTLEQLFNDLNLDLTGIDIDHSVENLEKLTGIYNQKVLYASSNEEMNKIAGLCSSLINFTQYLNTHYNPEIHKESCCSRICTIL